MFVKSHEEAGTYQHLAAGMLCVFVLSYQYLAAGMLCVFFSSYQHLAAGMLCVFFSFLSAPGRWYAVCVCVLSIQFVLLNPKPQTLNPKPQILNPKPLVWYVGVLSIQFVLYFYRICSLQNVCTLPLSLRNMFSTECTLFSISIEYVLYRMYVPCLYLYRICSLQNVCTRPLSLRNMFSTECMYLASISIEYVLYRMYLAA